MLYIQHITPPGHDIIIPNPNDKLIKIMHYLVNENKISKKWVFIPDTEIEIFFKLIEKTPVLAFRKHQKEIYIHIFGLQSYNLANPFALVTELYIKLKLGKPEKPIEPNWIHTIPLGEPTLSKKEVMLIHQITKSFFGTLYTDFKTNVLKK